MNKIFVIIGGAMNKPIQKGIMRKGIFISFSVFLLFTALFLLIYALSTANIKTIDALTAQAGIERASNQFDGVTYTLSLLPNSSLNYSINGASSFTLTDTMPAQFMNASSSDFIVFKSFVENYSFTNASINISGSLPSSLRISPQNISVAQTSTNEISFLPTDNNSGKTVGNYTIDVIVNNSPAPTIAWNPSSIVSNSSSDAVYVKATARVVGGSPNNISAYINRSALNILQFTHGSTLIVNATFNGTFLIGGLNISAIPSTSSSNSTTTQMLANANLSSNDNNWTKVVEADSTIAWYNSGRTGGSENISISGKGKSNDDDIAQNVTASTQPSSGTIDWCYRVTRWNGGTSSYLRVYLASPGETGLGTQLDTVTITGTGAWTCRNTSIPSGEFNSSGTYRFTARTHLQTTSGGSGKYISVLWDDFQLNFTESAAVSGSGPITITTTMNVSSVIDRISGGVVPSNITISVGNEFKKASTNG